MIFCVDRSTFIVLLSSFRGGGAWQRKIVLLHFQHNKTSRTIGDPLHAYSIPPLALQCTCYCNYNCVTMSDREHDGRDHGGVFPPPPPTNPMQQQYLDALLMSYQSHYATLPNFQALDHPQHSAALSSTSSAAASSLWRVFGANIITVVQPQRARADPSCAVPSSAPAQGSI